MEQFRISNDDSEQLAVSRLSDIGCVRKNNEDSEGAFNGTDPAQGCLLVVADGMGGAAAGEVASGLAVEKVNEVYFASPPGNPTAALKAAIEAANSAIFMKASDDPRLGGMGTTCTAVAVIGREAWFGHVGDSRAYHIRGADLAQLTKDHSLAAEFERKGGGGGAPARAKNVLTRCLGVKEEVKVDVSETPTRLEDDSALVLCSDGLSNLVEDAEVLHNVAMHLPDSACKRLVQLAKDRGGPDNITVQVARISRS